MEQRRATRYQMRVPVIFKWDDQQGLRQQGGGFTRDISTGGIFVSCPTSPPAGTAVALEVLLPPLEAEAQGLRLQADGQVVRLEESGKRGGFAAAADFGLRSAASHQGT